MATELQRQRAEINSIIDNWPYYCLEVKIYLLCRSLLKLSERSPTLRPIVAVILSLLHGAGVVWAKLQAKLDTMPKAKRILILIGSLLLSAGIILIASQSWQLALAVGIFVALPLGIWIGKQL